MTMNSFVAGFVAGVAFVFVSTLYLIKAGHESMQRKIKKLQERNADPTIAKATMQLDSIRSSCDVQIMGIGKMRATLTTPDTAQDSELGTVPPLLTLTQENGTKYAVVDVAKAEVYVQPLQKGNGKFWPTYCPKSLLVIKAKGGKDAVLFQDDKGADCKQLNIMFQFGRQLERFHVLCTPGDFTAEWRQNLTTLKHEQIFNVLLSRIFHHNCHTMELKRLLVKKITKKLKAIKPPSFVHGGIQVVDVVIGNQVPAFSDIEFVAVGAGGEYSFDTNLDYRGGFQIQLLVDYDVKPFTVPKVLITVKIERIQGRIHVSMGPPPSERLWLGFHTTPTIDLDFHHHVQGKLIAPLLNKTPHLTALVIEAIKSDILGDMLLPVMDEFPIPDVKDTPPSTPTSGLAPAVSPTSGQQVPPPMTVQPKWGDVVAAAQAQAKEKPASGGDSQTPSQSSNTQHLSPTKPTERKSSTPEIESSSSNTAAVEAAVAAATETAAKERQTQTRAVPAQQMQTRAVPAQSPAAAPTKQMPASTFSQPQWN